MTEEYEQIREGLIAMMCVGDGIFTIHSGSNGWQHIIARHHVGEIYENSFRVKEYNNGIYTWREIEYYDGHLYVWNMKPSYYNYRTDKRIKKMIEVIRSPKTRRMYSV
jgi:hypothetical protein